MTDTPLSLLERLRSPTDRDWARFVELYSPLLAAWARRAGLQSADADDVTQDVLAGLMRTLPTYRPEGTGSFRAWLKTVTMNKIRARLRGRRPAAGLPDDVAAHERDDELDRADVVRRAVQLMRTDFGETAWRACWAVAAEGRPGKEVAAELGISLGAVHAARFRVLARLRQELAGLWE